MDDDPLRLPTLSLAGEIAWLGSAGQACTFYLAPASALHAGPETLGDLLNSQRSFLPVRLSSSDRPVLIRREAILTAVVAMASEGGAGTADGSEPGERPRAAADLVELVLEEGVRVDGVLARVAPPLRGRVSDYFEDAPGFFAIQAGDRIVYVNKRRIVSVHF